MTERVVSEPRRILLLCLAGAGDVLMATPLMRELRVAFPAARIEAMVLQGRACGDLLLGNPFVDLVRVHDFRTLGPAGLVRVCLGLRGRYDVTVSTYPQNRLEYSIVARLIAAPVRVGFRYVLRCGAMERQFLTHVLPEDPRLHAADQNLRVLPEVFGRTPADAPRRLEVFPSPGDREAASAFVAGAGLAGRRLVGFHPGSGTTKNLWLKRWDPARWSELARQLAAESGTGVLVFGGPGEEPLVRQVVEGAGAGAVVAALGLPLPVTAAAMAALEVLVCADTLLGHVAAAMGTPVVAIFGPTSPVAGRPYGVRHEIVRLGLPCSPCYGYSRRGIRCTNPDRMACLTGIAPGAVAGAVARLRAQRGVQSGTPTE